MADRFVLHEDGTIELGWDEISCTLRRPKVGEWLSFNEEYARAVAWQEKETKGKKPTVLEAVEKGPFRPLYQRLMLELGDTKVELGDLPLWLCLSPPFQRIADWWLGSPLARQEAVTLQAIASR